VAGHPEGHPSSVSRHDEMIHLKEKIDAGADLIITQLFYDVTIFQQYVQQCRTYGITCPIIPGIMPIQSYSSFQRMTEYCQVSVPSHVWDQLEPVKEDDEAVKRVGCHIATEMCRQILSSSSSLVDGNDIIDGVHFYTLNLERSVTYILNQLGAIDIVQANTTTGTSTTSINNYNTTKNITEPIPDDNHNDLIVPTPNVEKDTIITSTGMSTTVRTTSGRTLPWRPSAIERRYKYEQVRPINWANRPKSYVVRTEDWDEYPNGRWGDATSPAFGELSDVSHFYSFSLGSDEDQRAMLGHHPKTHQDVYEVFAKYVEGTIPHIPWCETSLQPESFLIQKQLSQLNRSGYLTINSQPSVNGAPSSHKTFGWGGPGGYVYQKAYCECFCSPEHTKKLVAMVQQHKSMNLYAVNVMGEQIQEGVELGGVTALTWGVFPNREILQPTIFDPNTFLVWSEEAFSLWTYMWMNLYEYDSTSYTLIESIRDTYFLCAIIDNNYISTSTIWDAMQVAGKCESVS
jgi:methylenetetrahydrofolate reductase (NADPH)